MPQDARDLLRSKTITFPPDIICGIGFKRAERARFLRNYELCCLLVASTVATGPPFLARRNAVTSIVGFVQSFWMVIIVDLLNANVSASFLVNERCSRPKSEMLLCDDTR